MQPLAGNSAPGDSGKKRSISSKARSAAGVLTLVVSEESNAMSEIPEPESPPLEQYRSYLLLLARLQLEGPWRHQVDASDVVQQTLLEAHQQPSMPEGSSDRAAWLRRALANNIRDALRFLRRKKRDIRRQQSLDAEGEQGGPAIVEKLAASLATPSQLAVREEELLKLSEILLGLPSAEREAIVLHHLQGRPLREVAERLGRSTGAVAGLLHRGLRRLKQQMHSGNSSNT
jgi:RNA polymerase sigma-70 factor, ECF subfamily